MPDRKKVIKELEWQINVFTSYCASDERLLEAMKAAIALLKEQEYKDKMFYALEEDWKLLKEQPEIVRCNDCKHYDEKGTCMKNGIAMLTGHWFCADGERKMDDA